MYLWYTIYCKIGCVINTSYSTIYCTYTRGFEVFMVSDRLDHLETNKRKVYSVYFDIVIIYVILDNS